MTFRTLHDRILVKRDEPVKKIGLIEVPDVAQVPPRSGEVLAVGTDRDVKVGERIFFAAHIGQDVKVGDETRLMIYEMDILAVIDPSVRKLGPPVTGSFVEGGEVNLPIVNPGLRPIGSRVILKADPPEEKSGVIILPPSAAQAKKDREPLVSGTIIAMGPGMRTKKGGRWPMPDVKVGQRVLYFQNFAQTLEFEGVLYIAVADDQLRAAFEEEVANAG